MKVNALLCEDLNMDLETEKKLIKKAFMDLNIEHTLDCYCNPNEIHVDNRTYDMAFLDIELAEEDGFKIARELLSYNKNCIIMFITNYSVYLDKAFDINAFRFFQKPLDYNRLIIGLEKAMKRIRNMQAIVEVTNITDNSRISVHLDYIIYIENCNRHTRIITAKHDFVARETFSYIKKQINQKVDYFISPHNSLFVNYRYIKYYDKLSVHVNKGDNVIILDISRRYYSNFVNKFFSLVEESR